MATWSGAVMCAAFVRGGSGPLAVMVSAGRAPYIATGSRLMTKRGFARLPIDRFAITSSVSLAG
ncbi:MAG: hypothetical protein Q8P46_05510, partial [Hyphomicrobiales bacterium]|nr:hypothetical protein [Hyphomicrobiales bacterium]